METPIALSEARSRLLAALPPPPGGEQSVALAAALGRVCLDAVRCPTALPPFDRSLVDGFAVRCGGGARLPLGPSVVMGAAAPPLPPGTAAPVPTGGMIPAGADAVVMKEDARSGGLWVDVLRPPAPGQNIVRAGADAAAGGVVVPGGRRLRPPEIAMLATAGLAAVAVRARPRIAVLSTGDELVAPGAAPGPGEVVDSNGPALCAALARDGAEPSFLGIVSDARGAVEEAVRRGMDWDALLCSGGSSVGDRDFVPEVLAAAFGAPALFSGIAMRPGRPTSAFAGPRTWAVTLPGHAVSALVVYELLVREAVLRCGGEADPRPRGSASAELAAEVRAPADRDLYERVRLEGGRAVPLRGASATIGNLARADGLVRCPAGQALAAGSAVLVALLD